MIKKTVEYEDFNGVERTEDFYFHMSKNELADLETSSDGSFSDKIQTVIKSNNNLEIAKVAREFLLMSYGIKSEDGKRFIKSPEITKEFTESPAYDEIVFGFIDKSDDFAKFIEGIMPRDLVNKIENNKEVGAVNA